MPRDYKREVEIRRETVKRLEVTLPKETAEKLIQLLDEKGMTFAAWVKQHVDELFLGEEQ